MKTPIKTILLTSLMVGNVYAGTQYELSDTNRFVKLEHRYAGTEVVIYEYKDLKTNKCYLIIGDSKRAIESDCTIPTTPGGEESGE